jgi:hypothetical protein
LYRCLICAVLLLYVHRLFENGIFKGATTLNLTTNDIRHSNKECNTQHYGTQYCYAEYHTMILVYFTVGSTSSGSAFVIAPKLSLSRSHFEDHSSPYISWSGFSIRSAILLYYLKTSLWQINYLETWLHSDNMSYAECRGAIFMPSLNIHIFSWKYFKIEFPKRFFLSFDIVNMFIGAKNIKHMCIINLFTAVIDFVSQSVCYLQSLPPYS